MRPFTYEPSAVRVVFAVGAFDCVAQEARQLGGAALLLATRGRRALAEDLARQLGDAAAGIFAEAVMHVPIETARAAREMAVRIGARCCVAIGGGSTIGLAKAIALETALPIVAVPTTYSGSEMTPIYGITDGGEKKTGRSDRVLPKTVVYDPALTATLPAQVSGPSGLNAMAHCVEALYAPNRNPITSLIAAEGIRSLARSLPAIADDPSDIEARSEALYGACLAGTALGATSMGLHHKLCHTLGGAFNLPHAEVHAVIVPHATAFNRDAAPDAMRVIADALGAVDAAEGIYDLAVSLGAPVSLEQIGMPADGLDRAARLAVAQPYDNPRPVDFAGVRRLLDDAYRGRRPRFSA
jgi:maleylacetate reductase